MSQTYVMPNGLITKDPNSYAKAWTQLGKPFEQLGYRLVGVDPSVQITKGGTVFNIPVDVALRLIELENT